jgi:hypothetical protein
MTRRGQIAAAGSPPQGLEPPGELEVAIPIKNLRSNISRANQDRVKGGIDSAASIPVEIRSKRKLGMRPFRGPLKMSPIEGLIFF